MTNYTRRSFIKASVAGTGGLLLAFHLPVSGKAIPHEPWADPGAELNAWLTIGSDDVITIRVAQAEMGQGVFTTMPMIVAEELEADWRNIRAENASIKRHMAENQVFDRMLTADSGAVRLGRAVLQKVGAEARERLIKAAAERWLVSPGDCYADYGSVYNNKGDSFTYGQLAEDAAKVRVANVKIKSPDDFNLLGLPTQRLDIPSKVDGSAQYSMDVRVPGMVYAVVKHCPVFGGKVRSLRFNAVRNMPGVLKAVRMESAVAVVAEHFWQAKTAADEMPIYWNELSYGKTNSQRLKNEYVSALDQEGTVLVKRGNIVQAMDEAETSIESDYVSPYLSHAALEPMNCTVHLVEDRMDLWVGTQDPEAAMAVAAQETGLPIANISIHNCYIGGSFGRRRSMDFIREAITIARSVGKPVQMIWTREEDQRAGEYRPMSVVRFKAGFDLDKQLIAYTSHSITHSIARDKNLDVAGIDPSSTEGLLDLPFNLKHVKISHTDRNTHYTSGYWRSRGHSQNAYAKECFMDEMAVAAKQDPMSFRRGMYRNQPAVMDVLEVLQEESGWGKRLPRGSARGVAIHESFGTICGQVAQVSVTQRGALTVDRIVCVIDCGNLINPTTAEQQVESGIVFGLSAARYGKLTIENGVVLENNYDTYEVVRMADMPVLDIHFALSGGDKWGGLGEPATPPVAPAICNALFQVTGRRIRALPVRDYLLIPKR
jgi:isoquinoline 1-oxidoreductase subunit beta